MKRYLLWKSSQAELDATCLEASPAPSTSVASTAANGLCLPTISAENGSEEVGVLRSAFSPVSPAASAHQQWPEMGASIEAPMCSPVLLDRLGPNILRSHVPTAQYKAIPNNGPLVDLDSWAGKEVGAWGMDDVIAWMIGVARKHHIPVEDLNMHRFANCSGPLLMLMSQQHFLDRDAVYGYLLYMEFRKLVGDDGSLLDDWLRSYRQSEEPPGRALLPELDPQADPSGGLSPQLSPNVGLSAMLSAAAAPLKSPPLSLDAQLPSSSAYPHPAQPQPPTLPPPAGGKIRRNKDGKPRKRSQHNKGNKLWEFIRDALKDPSTCPSVVRWEDAKEGVFRIVESERLARLWGERKNNTKMTYEKLSRAMRYYYNTKILLPVSGRRLVYKFGPNAVGWRGGSSSGDGVELGSGPSGLDLAGGLWAESLGAEGGGVYGDNPSLFYAEGEEDEDEEEELLDDGAPAPVQIHLSMEDPGSLLLT